MPPYPERDQTKPERQKCTVLGVLNGGRAMCGSVIVGLEFCGASG